MNKTRRINSQQEIDEQETKNRIGAVIKRFFDGSASINDVQDQLEDIIYSIIRQRQEIQFELDDRRGHIARIAYELGKIEIFPRPQPDMETVIEFLLNAAILFDKKLCEKVI